MPVITDHRLFDKSKLHIGVEELSKKKDSKEFCKIHVSYNGGKLLLPITTKTMGVKTMETQNGYQRRTMPFVFEEPLSKKQNPFIATFHTIEETIYNELSNRGYESERLMKLGNCFWAERILYANIVSSIWDSSDNTRFFLKGNEVPAGEINDCTDYQANGAILIDSIYVGESSICIQAKLYEVHLSPAEKRARVVWD